MFKTIAATSVLAGAALAQVQSPLKIAEQALQFLSSDCQQTLVSFANTSSPLYQCLQIDSLIPAVTTNGTIIEDVDDYLSAVCYSQPCSPALLNQTAMALIDGCGKDLSMFGISNSTVEKIFEVYPLARDVACLKNNQTEVLSNATIPINMGGYNTTNGTFCLTELATNLTGYLGVNLTNSYVDSLILGGNYSAFMNLANIPPTAICSDCIFAGYDMINAQYPQIGMTVVDAKSNMTVNSYLNSTCMATNMTVTSNGTLPYGVNEAAVNASETTILPSITATIDVTSIMSAAMATGAMPSAPSAPSVSAGQMAEKRRWIGQYSAMGQKRKVI